MDPEPSKDAYVYVIKPSKYGQKSYCGYTNDLKNRIDQHNGKKAGGAKSTHGKSDWEYYIVIKGFKDNNEAMSCEWLMKHPTRKKNRPKEYTGVSGRVKSLNLVLSYDRWSDNTEGLENGIEEGRTYTLYIAPKYFASLDRSRIKSNVVVKDIKDLLL